MATTGDQPPPAASGIELTTLFLSAVASAAAAYITSKIWAPGTLFSAAMSPVIVALVKEGLRRPTEKVANVVPGVVPSPSRWSRPGPGEAGLLRDEPAPAQPTLVDPEAPHVVLPPVVAADHGPVNVYSTRASRLRWRVAVITGLLGFAIAVLLFTVPELISGQSLGRGSSDATTFFGGHGSRHRGTSTSTTNTSTTSTTSTTTKTTPTTTQTTPQQQTQTQPQPTTAAPAPQQLAPSSATPAPTSTTPNAGAQATP